MLRARGETVGDAISVAVRTERTVSPAAVEARGGLTVAETAELIQGFGFPKPAPDEPCLTDDEAGVLVEFARLRDVLPHDMYMQLARVYGQQLGQIAQTEVQLFRLFVERRLLERNSHPVEGLLAVQTALEQLRPLAAPLLIGVHERWVEHHLTQATIGEAEVLTEDPGAVRVALLFCDLKGFTAYADREGDTAAIEAIERFAHAVLEERGEAGQVVKALGDGYLLAFRGPRDAVAVGARIIDHLRGEPGPGVHASVHAGPAVFRNGDYFGRTVNLAAHLLDLSGQHELVATEEVAGATAGAFRWKSRGTARVRGLRKPVKVFSLRAATSAGATSRRRRRPRRRARRR